MNWQEISGNWVWLPRQPSGIIHFLGGAFVASAPNVTYRSLLEDLGSAGYAIVATPFVNTLDHRSIARNALNRFDTLLDRLRARHLLPQGYLPIYGLGHSMGSKLHLLIGSLYEVERAGNILLSFNNYPIRRAIPFIEPLQIDTTFNLEFTPSPEETNELIFQDYAVRRNLLIRFQDDSIDQTLLLNPLLKKRFDALIALRTLPGNHLTPLSQDLNWQTGEIFTPLDAIGQWLKQGLAGDNSRLKAEIRHWLNPTRSSQP